MRVGVHGDATAVTQGFSVATESGMASAQINVAPGLSGYNPSAGNPGSSADGFENAQIDGVRGVSGHADWGSGFCWSLARERAVSVWWRGERTANAASVGTQSTNFSSTAPRETRPDEGQVPLFNGANAQQLAAMEQRVPLLYWSPDRHPHTESSSIPHDAIQAEVARQLDGLKQQLRAEQERAGRAEAELLRIRSSAGW